MRRVAPSSLSWFTSNDKLIGKMMVGEDEHSAIYARDWHYDGFDELLIALGDFSRWIVLHREEIYKLGNMSYVDLVTITRLSQSSKPMSLPKWTDETFELYDFSLPEEESLVYRENWYRI